jgi:hypothetical protein
MIPPIVLHVRDSHGGVDRYAQRKGEELFASAEIPFCRDMQAGNPLSLCRDYSCSSAPLFSRFIVSRFFQKVKFFYYIFIDFSPLFSYNNNADENQQKKIILFHKKERL